MKPREWLPPAVDRLGRFTAVRWRGRLVVPAHVHPLVRRLFDLLNDTGWCMTEVCRAAGLAEQTIKGWRVKNPQIGTFEAALNVMGYRLAIVPIGAADHSADASNMHATPPNMHAAGSA